jgi:hypothetical protein
MAGFSPWSASGLLAGAGQRLTVAAGTIACLWLAVLWASLGVAPPATQRGTVPAETTRPPPPAPLHAVAVAATPAPGGGQFDRFGIEMQPAPAPVNAGGDVAFFARLMRSAAGEALFLSRDGKTVVVANAGAPAPGGGTLSGFTEHPAPALNKAGTVAFAATIDGGRSTDAVLTWARGRLASVAQSGVKAPDIAGGVFFDFGRPAINDAGDVAFLTTIRHGHEMLDAVYVNAKGKLAKIVAAGDAAPDGGVFSAIAAPVLNNRGVVAFAALVEQGQRPAGIFVATDGALRRAVGAGDAAPDGGIYARLSENIGIDDAGHIAFTAFLGQTATRAGIFLAGEHDVKRAAALGTAAPGGGRFASFGDTPSLAPDGKLAFIAAIDGANGSTGAFSYGPDGLARIATVGDSVAGARPIAYFPLNAAIAAGPGTRVTFHAGFKSGDEQVDAIVLFAPVIQP